MHLVSIDGLEIKKLRQFLLRCFSCYKYVVADKSFVCWAFSYTPASSLMLMTGWVHRVCRDVTKVFCPACGNDTLRKAAVEVDEDGSTTVYYNPRARYSTRGTVVRGESSCFSSFFSGRACYLLRSSDFLSPLLVFNPEGERRSRRRRNHFVRGRVQARSAFATVGRFAYSNRALRVIVDTRCEAV